MLAFVTTIDHEILNPRNRKKYFKIKILVLFLIYRLCGCQNMPETEKLKRNEKNKAIGIRKTKFHKTYQQKKKTSILHLAQTN